MARKVSIELVADYSSVQRGFAQAGRSAKNFDKDISHSTRGILAGSGAIKGLGRSLAFASGGFLAFAGVAGALRDSVIGAENLKKAQEGLTVSIEHTHGSVKKLLPQYEATAKAAQQFGINEADALTALNRATVLTGNAAKAQRAYEEALVISKATGKDFNQVLTATAKGQEGITTSLQRYGIRIAKGTDGTKQFNMVMSRFGGQAKANTSTIDRFNATLQNTEEVIGTAILPILNKYLNELGRWLDKMTKTGRLQRDVQHGAHDIATALNIAADAAKKVDSATGSFVNTLKILVGLKLVSYLRGIAIQYGAIAANEARANTNRFVPGPGNTPVPLPGPAPSAGTSLAERIAPYTITGSAAAATAARNATFRAGLARLGGISEAAVAGFALGDAGAEMGKSFQQIGPDGYMYYSLDGKHWTRGNFVGFPGAGAITLPGFRRPGSGFKLFGAFPSFGDPRRRSAASGPFGAAKPLPAPFKTFTVPIADQIAQAQAGLTKTTADDVAAAKKIIAYVKRLIAAGKLSGPALVTALGEEASAMGVIQSAQQQAAAAAKAAAQKAKEAAAKAKAKQQAFLDNLIDPIKIEVELSKAQAQGKPTTKILRELRASALKALHTGKLSLQQQKAAWDQIASLNQQIKDSLKKQTSPLGGFKQASTKALTANLGLSEAQRKALRARLSQLGPNGTVPNQGVGAYGYQIGANDRPIVIHHTTKLDGKVVARSTTRHQQNHRRRNPTQRRGPNAATGA